MATGGKELVLRAHLQGIQPDEVEVEVEDGTVKVELAPEEVG